MHPFFVYNLFLAKVDKRITYIKFYKDFVSGLCRVNEPHIKLDAITTRGDTSSHNRIDLIQSLVPTHYACGEFILFSYRAYFQHTLVY